MEDDKNMFEPDVVVLCRDGDNDERLRDSRRIEGAPDFVLEVLSSSTRRRDLFLKVTKYKMAGVREYWIIDPEKKRVVVYDLEHDELPLNYTFDDKVPVIISEGECSIDFVKISEVLDRYSRYGDPDLSGL
jgi:Uma2 family endonuclease